MSRRKTITLDEFMALGPSPYWTREQIEAAAGKRWTLDDLLRLRGAKGLSDNDWTWAVAKSLPHFLGQVLADRVSRLWACNSAAHALRRVTNPDPRSFAAIRVAQKFARGNATCEELTAARDAAWDAWTGAGAAAVAESAAGAAWEAAGVATEAARAAAMASVGAAWAATWAAWATAGITMAPVGATAKRKEHDAQYRALRRILRETA